MKVNHVISAKYISHNISYVINWLPNDIRDKFLSHSFSGAALYTRKYSIQMYQRQCLTKNCFGCKINYILKNNHSRGSRVS